MCHRAPSPLSRLGLIKARAKFPWSHLFHVPNEDAISDTEKSFCLRIIRLSEQILIQEVAKIVAANGSFPQTARSKEKDQKKIKKSVGNATIRVHFAGISTQPVDERSCG